MSWLARYLARWTWAAMLWLMRRPWMKRLQRSSTKLFPASMQDKARRSMIRQNRFARRIGLPMLTVSMNLFLASIILTGTYFAVLNLYESGTLSATDEMKHYTTP